MGFDVGFSRFRDLSESYDFQLTKDEIIKEACVMSNDVDIREDVPPELASLASSKLQQILKTASAKSYFISTQEWVPIQLKPSDRVEKDGLKYIALRTHNSTSESTPGTGGVFRYYWKEITTVDVLEPWELGRVYENIGQFALDSFVQNVEKDLKIIDPDLESQNRLRVVALESRFDFNPFASGVPTRFYFKQGTPYNILFLDPVPEAPLLLEVFVTLRPRDIDLGSDTLPLKQEYIGVVIERLAVELGKDNGLPEDRMRRLERGADKKEQDARSNNSDKGDIFFVSRRAAFRGSSRVRRSR